MIVRITLQDVLNDKNISQHQLSKMTDIPQPAINLMCLNKSVRFPLDRLARICEALDCEINDILKLEKELAE